MAKSAPYYRGVRGSSSLSTARVDPAAVPAEALQPGEMRRVPFAGELLGAARVRGRYAAIPLDAFDRAGEALEAEAQAAWLHLLRLSYGEGRNWARAGKKELMARLRLSERRLLRVLDELVAGGFARPLHRDNRGTLWRVMLPGEAFGEPLGDEVLLGRATPAPVGAAPPDGHAKVARQPAVARAGAVRAAEVRPAAAQTAAAQTDDGAPAGIPPAEARTARLAAGRPAAPRERALARALCQARGLDGDAALAAALREVRELLDDGLPLKGIEAAIEAVRRRAARAGAAGGAGSRTSTGARGVDGDGGAGAGGPGGEGGTEAT